MSKAMTNFAKGIFTGVVVGTTVGMVVQNIAKPANPFKRGAGKAVKNVGAFVNTLSSMMK